MNKTLDLDRYRVWKPGERRERCIRRLMDLGVKLTNIGVFKHHPDFVTDLCGVLDDIRELEDRGTPR